MEKDDIPPIGDIPMPPKPEGMRENPIEEAPEISPQIHEETIKPVMPEEPGRMEDSPVPKTQEAVETPSKQSTEPVQPQQETTKTNQIDEPPTSDNKEETVKVDFSLPDFTAEDLELGKEVAETQEAKKKKIKEEEIEVTPPVKAEPIFKPGEDPTKKDLYLNTMNCNQVFNDINESQTILQGMLASIEENNERKKIWMHNCKNFHNELDAMQEKLMKIDNSLFER